MKLKNYIPYSLFSLFLLLILLIGSCTTESSSEVGANPSDVMLSEALPATGHFMLISPKQMEVNKSEDVEVWITTDSIRDASFFKENLSKNDSIVVEKVRIGKIMEVKLMEENTASSNFSIAPLSSPQQIVDNSTAAIWKWSVRPLHVGVYKLIVIARIKMMTKDLQLIGYKDLPVIDQAITVKVSDQPIDDKEEKNAFYWLLLIPVVGLLTWFFLKKKNTINKELIDTDEFNAFETKIQGFIKKNRIKLAFESLESFIQKHPNETIENSLVLLKSNYSNNESQLNKNLITNDQYKLERSKIINELLLMIDSFESK